jgi:hypothetical protein
VYAIDRAILSTSPIGKGEGIGPGLSGLTPADHFRAGHPFWLFFLVKATCGGTVLAKWYANGHFYRISSRYIPALPARLSARTPVPAPGCKSLVEVSISIESDFSITYGQPAAGRVELYWNGQFAMTLFFVVRA